MKSTQKLRWSKQDKREILVTLHRTMAGYISEIRQSVERIIVWSTGSIFLIVGWAITLRHNMANYFSIAIGGVDFVSNLRIVIILGIAVFSSVLLATIYGLNKRFNGIATVIRNLNEVEGVYEKGAFLKNGVLFPETWKNFGSRRWTEPIFLVAYLAVCFVAFFGALVVYYIK